MHLQELREKLSSLDPSTVPVVSKEDIIDRVIDGFPPTRKVYQVIVTPDGNFRPINSANLKAFSDSVSAIYAEMTPEELKTFKEVTAHVYQKRLDKNRISLETLGMVVICLIGVKRLLSAIITH